jgi:NTP pyrophosphatase (non-canonical NTP hydrolase)
MLTFHALRIANLLRLPQFKNAKGEYTNHGDWKLSAWSNAALGELGEAANIIKKIERGDFSLEEARENLGKELADVVTYVDLLADKAGIDLGLAVKNKFNEVSDRVGCDIKID